VNHPGIAVGWQKIQDWSANNLLAGGDFGQPASILAVVLCLAPACERRTAVFAETEQFPIHYTSLKHHCLQIRLPARRLRVKIG
jgi:hypothetical protein